MKNLCLICFKEFEEMSKILDGKEIVIWDKDNTIKLFDIRMNNNLLIINY